MIQRVELKRMPELGNHIFAKKTLIYRRKADNSGSKRIPGIALDAIPESSKKMI